jgi:teichuronic acid exporter
MSRLNRKITVEERGVFKATVVAGFSTLIIREFFLKLFSFLGQIVLARILAPSEFGVYLIIVFIVSLFGLFSDVGLSLAIIQKKNEPTRQELSGIFWLKVLLSLGLIIIIWIFSPFIKVFYPTFLNINIVMLQVFSFTLLLASLRTIPVSLLERKIKYNLISIVDIIGVIVYYAVAIVGAFMHAGVWSFIIAVMVRDALETVMLNIIQPFLPQFILLKKDVLKMIKYGIYIQGNSLVMFAISSIIPVIGGRLSGPYAVGLLDFANSLASLPNIIAMNFSRVAFTSYSRIQEEKELLFKSIHKSVSMLAIVLYFFPVIIFSFGGELVQIVYTDKWMPAVPALYWFSASVLFYPIITALGQVILAIGKSKEIFQVTLITAIVGWLSAFFLVNVTGFTGIAIANFIIYILLFVFYISIIKKSGFNTDSFIGANVPKVFASFLVLIFCFISNFLLPQSLLFLILKLLLAFVAYILCMYLLAKSDMQELFVIIKSVVKRR